MDQSSIMQDFNGKLAELSTLIKSWNLIQISSKREFDKLSGRILNNLYQDEAQMKIQRIIESEFCLVYGLYKTEFDSYKLSEEIMNWWNK